MYQQAPGIAFVMIPLVKINWLFTHYGVIWRLGEKKIILFPSFSQFFFFPMENVYSPSVFLNYFLLYLFVFSFNRIFLTWFQKRSSLNMLWDLPHKTSLWFLVVLVDISACAFCNSVCSPLSLFFCCFFHAFGSSVSSVKSYLISGLFSLFLLSQSINQFGRSL